MWPQVTVNELNLQQGPIDGIERQLLFIGDGDKTTHLGSLQAVTPQSDLDILLGSANSPLKSNLAAALLNAGQQAYFHVYALKEGELWADVVKQAQAMCAFEGVVVINDGDKTDITTASELRSQLLSQYGKWVWFILSIPGIVNADSHTPLQTWDEYANTLSQWVKEIAAPAVQVVPRNWGNEPGVLAGRLANNNVTVADSPARVMTGPLLALGQEELPVDKDGNSLSLATLQSLQQARFSVPIWYTDYPGFFWSDGRTLDNNGGDYQSIENLRIVDKAARRIRAQAISRIGDRALNSTPASIAANKQYFAKTLRQMSKSSVINGVAFPGECKPPQDGDIVITWKNSKTVQILFLVRTYACPLGIEISLLLDSHQGE